MKSVFQCATSSTTNAKLNLLFAEWSSFAFGLQETPSWSMVGWKGRGIACSYCVHTFLFAEACYLILHLWGHFLEDLCWINAFPCILASRKWRLSLSFVATVLCASAVFVNSFVVVGWTSYWGLKLHTKRRPISKREDTLFTHINSVGPHSKLCLPAKFARRKLVINRSTELRSKLFSCKIC